MNLPERIADKYLVLTTALELFPLCMHCGRNLSTERITRLSYDMSRNRFACNPCAPEEPNRAA